MLRKLLLTLVTLGLLGSSTSCTLYLGQFAQVARVATGAITIEPANGVMYDVQSVRQSAGYALEQLMGPAIKVIRGRGQNQNETFLYAEQTLYFEPGERSLRIAIKPNLKMSAPPQLVALTRSGERSRAFSESNSWSRHIDNNDDGATDEFEVRIFPHGPDWAGRYLRIRFYVVSGGSQYFNP